MTSIAELVQATKVYYSTVEEFLTSDPLLSNLRHMAGHIMRECNMYNSDSEFILCEKNEDVCVDSLINRYWEELFGKVEELLSNIQYAGMDEILKCFTEDKGNQNN